MGVPGKKNNLSKAKRDALVVKNMKFAEHIVEEQIRTLPALRRGDGGYWMRGGTREDLLSVAYLAMVEASKLYTPNRVGGNGKKVTFVSYAAPRVRRYVMNEAMLAGVIRKKAWMLAKEERLSPSMLKLRETFPRIDLRGIHDYKLEHACRSTPDVERVDSIEESAHLLSFLTTRQKRLLGYRFTDGMTLEAIGKREGITREWARRLIDRAVDTLRRAVGEGVSA